MPQDSAAKYSAKSEVPQVNEVSFLTRSSTFVDTVSVRKLPKELRNAVRAVYNAGVLNFRGRIRLSSDAAPSGANEAGCTVVAARRRSWSGVQPFSI